VPFFREAIPTAQGTFYGGFAVEGGIGAAMDFPMAGGKPNFYISSCWSRQVKGLQEEAEAFQPPKGIYPKSRPHRHEKRDAIAPRILGC
jgi:hypothetical protein